MIHHNIYFGSAFCRCECVSINLVKTRQTWLNTTPKRPKIENKESILTFVDKYTIEIYYVVDLLYLFYVVDVYALFI